jgi:hypothetical protein
MQAPSANTGSKTFILVAVIVVALAGAYYFYQSGSKTATDATSGVDNSSFDTFSNTEEGDGSVVGADVYSLLGQIQSLKIDPTFFARTVYQSLVDYTVEIPPQPVGRPNPFAPISGSSGSQSADAAAAARTLPQR